MSSNLVPQQLSISSMEMGQLEPGGSSMPEIQMGGMGSVPSAPESQQVLVSNNQMDMMANYPGSQDLSTPYMQLGHIGNTNGNFGSQKFLTPSNQFGEMGLIHNNVGSYQLLSPMKRKAPVEPMFLNPGTHQLSMPNKRVAQLDHRPWLQQVPAANKRALQVEAAASSPSSQNLPNANKKMVKMESFSGRSGTQRPSSQKNQTSQKLPSPKAQNESFESVRSKMRDSLAAALALVNQQTDKSQESGKKSQGDAERIEGKSLEQPHPQHEIKEPKENSPSSETCSTPKSTNPNTSDSTLTTICDEKEFQSSNILPYDVSFGDNLFVKDDLLQGNGLSWVMESDIEMADGKDILKQEVDQEMGRHPEEQAIKSLEQIAVQTPEQLAFQIESELFKLFGGVNKKYKEKGRSLLFNLKDRNNPELRERVMSGDIPPERLCSMTAEELASKELSEWRMAKAEELAQMVVLPDSELDMRRLVKKTHKGEVEVEQFDSAPMEAPISHDQPRTKEAEVSTPVKSVKRRNEAKSSGQNSNLDESFTFPTGDGSDLLQGLMVDDALKDLPPIVSLDEFMESLDNEPPFEILPENVSEKGDSETGSESKSYSLSPKNTVEIDVTEKKPESIGKTEDSLAVDKPQDSTAVDKTSGRDELKSGDSGADAKSGDMGADVKSSDSQKTESTPVLKPKGEHVWGGCLQLSVSTKASVIGIYKSGEKTSVKEWPSFVEIKGRVRLEPFEKFLQELPQSRSRAVMVVHFVLKEGSSESEFASVQEVRDSYISDERVGYAEPCSGVELYICPPHNKTCDMLSSVIQKEQVEELNTIDNGLIGVYVWRKLISPKPSHHKHISKKQHYTSSSSRKQHDTNSSPNFASKPSQRRALPPPTNTVVTPDDDEAPPGFGPPASRDDDDLPEFNFHGSNPSLSQFSTQSRPPRGNGLYPESTPRPVDKMRELILKYGQNNSRALWNDDDIPEWQPNAPPSQYQQPQLQAVNNYQQPLMRPHVGPALQQQPLQPIVNVASGLHTPNPYWQQGNRLAPPATEWACQPGSGQFYAEPDRATAAPQGIAWRQNTPKSRGF